MRAGGPAEHGHSTSSSAVGRNLKKIQVGLKLRSLSGFFGSRSRTDRIWHNSCPACSLMVAISTSGLFGSPLAHESRPPRLRCGQRCCRQIDGLSERSPGVLPSMQALNSSFALWCLAGIHVTGLSSAILARMSHGTRLEGPSYRLFFAVLAIVGTSTMASLEWGHGCCLALGTTLSLMVLLGVWEVPRPRRVRLGR